MNTELLDESGEILNAAFGDGVEHRIADGDGTQSVNGFRQNVILAIGVFSEENIFAEQGIAAAVTAGTAGNVDAFASFKDRIVINELGSAVDVRKSLSASTAEFSGFKTAAGSVDGKVVAFVRRGEVGRVVQQCAVTVFHVDHKGIVDVDLRVKHALIRTVGGEKFVLTEEIVDMVILRHNGGVAGCPAFLVLLRKH